MISKQNNRPPYPARGQIYVFNLGENSGCVQDGKRPVLVLSANKVCKTSPVVTVAPITSVLKRTDLPGHIILPEIEALDKPSMLVLEQMRTVNVEELGYYCGMLRGQETWYKINVGIKKVLGLWHEHPTGIRPRPKAKFVTCLCGRCISYYRNNPMYRIRRLTPVYGAKETCDRCGYYSAYEYLITEKGAN